LGSVPASPEVNQSVTFTATVAATSGTVVPTGSVTFTQGATQLCPSAGLTVGSASSTATCVYTFTSATAGTTITATYSGDSNFGTGTITSRSEVVTASGTTTGLTSSPAASTVNQQVTFTAVVTPTFPGAALPSGTVTFVDNSTSTNLCVETLSGGVVPVCNFTFPTASTHSVVAKYSGDTNFTLSNSVADSQTVNKTATTTELVSSLPTAAVNQLITFTATITPAITGATNPGGSVTFTETPSAGSPTNLTCSVAQPIAVSTTANVTTAACTASLPANGNYTITATYSGNSNFLASPTPGTVIQPVGLTPTTTTVSPSLPSSFVNEMVTFTATVTPTITGSTTPTGSVAFTYKVGSQSGILCATSSLNTTTGIATCTAPLPLAGSYSITVAYSGDPNFASSSNSSSLLALTVNQPVTTLGLSSSLPSSSVVNQAVSFTAVITPAYTGTTVPTGAVTFTDTLTSTTLCTIAVSATGTVPACNFAFTSPAMHTISAVYSGDANFPKTTSAPLSQLVTTTPTTTAMVSSPTSSTVNQSVLFTATVTPADSGAIIPTGTVAFTYVLNGGTPVILCGTAPLSNLGIASCTAPLPAHGAYTITATYSGDANFKLSSGTTTQSVVGSATTTALVAAPSPSSVNQPVLFTATVKTTVTGSTSPTGTVAFSYTLNGGASVNLCAAAAVTAATGVATCLEPLPTTAPASAPYTITANYSGDSNFAGSSNTAPQTVTPANLTVVVTSSQGTSSVNQAVTFTATLTVANAGTAQPAATVAFKDTLTGSTLCANAALTSTGGGAYTAACSAPVTNLWIAATHPIVAVYGGDPNFPAATSAVFPQLVKPTSTAASLISSLPLAIATETVTFTATVSPTITGPILPSGYFTFTSTGTWNPAASCQAAPVAPVTSGTSAGTATASCTATFPATASTQTITAVYANDSNFTSSSSAVSQTVQNFNIANSVTSTLTPTPSTGPVILTQGYSTATTSAAGTDPFNPTTVSVVVTSTGGFADMLNASCVVTNSTHAVVTDPSCTLSTTTTPPTSTTISGATGTALIYTLSASATAPVGAYNVTLTANDSATPALSTVAAPLTLSIIGVANPLSLARGASGQENVSFNTFAAPQSDTFAAVVCGTVVPLVNGVAGSPITSPGVNCTSQIPTGGIPIVSGGTTTVAVSISTGGTKTAALQGSSSISMAAFLGVPLLALLGWVGSRKSPRRNFFRFLGLIVLLVGASFASGCGGSFSSSSTTTSSGIAAGSYLVQVVGTDQNGVTYYAAIPLDVSSN
jgi:large repetitive protein